MITFTAHVVQDLSMDQVQVWVRGKAEGAKGESLIPKITVETVSEGARVEPFLVGDEGVDMLQARVDAAFEFGIVPRQLEDHRAELKATKGHLSDMRNLTFGLLEIPQGASQ